MALVQRQCDLNSSTSSLRHQHSQNSKTSSTLIQSFCSDISICLQRSEDLSNGIGGFCRQFKNQQSEIKKLQQILAYKKKKQGFKKNQQYQKIQYIKPQKQPYSFTPTVVIQSK